MRFKISKDNLKTSCPKCGSKMTEAIYHVNDYETEKNGVSVRYFVSLYYCDNLNSLGTDLCRETKLVDTEFEFLNKEDEEFYLKVVGENE